MVRASIGTIESWIFESYMFEFWGPLGIIWDLWGAYGDHLGNRFDEVIGFITDPDLPECADRSV